jgi:hypothetical protein
MRPAKIVAIVIGALLIIISVVLLAGGGALLWVNGVSDNQGFLSSSDKGLQTTGHALVTPDIRMDLGPAKSIPGGGSVRIQVTSSGAGPVFVGIGPTSQVMGYLSGVAYDEVTNIGWFSSGGERYRHHDGTAAPAPPGQQSFWVAKVEGTGAQDIQWDVQSGTWTAVLMNADGSAPVSADVTVGLHIGLILPLGIGLTAGGVVLLAVGITLIVLGARRPRRPQQPMYGYPGMPPGPGQPPYGQPPYGQPPHNQPPYGQPPSGPPYSQQHVAPGPYAPPPYQPASQGPPPYRPTPPPPTPPAGTRPAAEPQPGEPGAPADTGSQSE